jgi:outer membrane receptor protein involved in Fe transport
VAALLAIALPAAAQQTTGSITGRVLDDQGAAVPGATVTARHTETGFVRTDVSDAEGIYRLNALPVGPYDVVTELQGFTRVEQKGLVVNVGQNIELNVGLKLAQLAETITVTGESPLISTTASSVGQVVDVGRIENLPLNGRQFANLAATVPGVGLGFHSDPTKSTQFSPQINGGNGRNVNYQIDGGDNNDDTVGGLLQAYPLEAIQEFNFVTQRFKAEYGRSNGGVLNVVTKAGTNDFRGSWFTLFRDKALNAMTFSERIANDRREANGQEPLDKQDYRRYQFGGSFGGPILLNKAHFFAAFERTQQDTKQTVDTLGLFPTSNGVYDIPLRENLFTGKLTTNLTPEHYLAIRYGYNKNTQPYNAGLRIAPSAWSTSTNTFNSINVNHNWVVGQSKLNEFIFQYADFANSIPLSSSEPYLLFPNGVQSGGHPNTPQTTEQTKWQFRDDFTWTVTGMGGIAHDLKAGASWIHEPHLFITFNGGKVPQLTMASDSLTGLVQLVTLNGGAADVNIPMELYAAYVQDDWKVTDRLTLNLGLRYDYVTGVQIDQSRNPNFVALQAAARAGRFDGQFGGAFDGFGEEPKEDSNNIQPRLGAVYDVRGDGRDVLRAGWGVYYDFGYTNSNVLFPALDAAGGSGGIFSVNVATGILKADGTPFTAADPLSTIAHLNTVDTSRPPLLGQVVSPRLQQPYTYQTNVGWSHQLNDSTAVQADYVRVQGRDLNIRFRPNYFRPGTTIRQLADLTLNPNNQNLRIATNIGESDYHGLILGVRRRMSAGVDFTASYTLSKAESTIGTANDELDQNYIQDVHDPLAGVQNAPGIRTDARHRVSISAVVQAPWDIQIAPFFIYRSALPIFTFEGIDTNRDGNVNDITASAYKYTGLNDDGTATFEETGACENVNCSRRAPFSQLNLRLSKGFNLGGRARIEAIGEVFNLFNAKNPAWGLTTRRLAANGTPLAAFMQPTAFAGDFQQPEQRVGQVGFRVTF